MDKRAESVAVLVFVSLFSLSLGGACQRATPDLFASSGATCADRHCDGGTTCVEEVRPNGQPYAACAIGSGGRDVRCSPEDEDVTYCDGNTWVSCHGRFRENTFDCGAEHCVQIGTAAKCVPETTPNPSCRADAKSSTFCSGDELIECFGPYLNDSLGRCADGKLCRAGACVLRPDPDPRCTRAAQGGASFCDGDVAVQCFEAFHIAEQDCAHFHRRCVDDGISVRCAE